MPDKLLCRLKIDQV